MRDLVPLETIALALREARAVSGVTSRRADAIAMAAIREVYPNANMGEVAKALGMRRTQSTVCVTKNRASPSWDEVHVDHVVGALVAPQYGARAA